MRAAKLGDCAIWERLSKKWEKLAMIASLPAHHQATQFKMSTKMITSIWHHSHSHFHPIRLGSIKSRLLIFSFVYIYGFHDLFWERPLDTVLEKWSHNWNSKVHIWRKKLARFARSLNIVKWDFWSDFQTLCFDVKRFFTLCENRKKYSNFFCHQSKKYLIF